MRSLLISGFDDASLRRLIDQAEHGSHDRRALFMRLRPEASVEGHVEQAIALLAETARRLWPVWFTDVSFAACGAGTLGKLAAGAIARKAATPSDRMRSISASIALMSPMGLIAARPARRRLQRAASPGRAFRPSPDRRVRRCVCPTSAPGRASCAPRWSKTRAPSAPASR